MQLGDGRFHIDLWIGPESLRDRADRFLIAWGIGPQRMFDPIAELTEH